MVQVCVVPNNLCFGLSLFGEPRCLLVQVVGQFHCSSNYRELFSTDLESEIECILKCTYLYFGSMTYSRIVLDTDCNEPPLVSIRRQ